MISSTECKKKELEEAKDILNKGIAIGDFVTCDWVETEIATKTILQYIEQLENELKRIKNLDISRLVEDYETGELINKDKVRKLIKDKEIYLPMTNTIVDEYTECEVICREIKTLKELLEEK